MNVNFGGQTVLLPKSHNLCMFFHRCSQVPSPNPNKGIFCVEVFRIYGDPFESHMEITKSENC